MAPNRTDWREKALELAKLYASDRDCASRQLKNHRHFIHVEDDTFPYVSAHAVRAGLYRLDMCDTRSHSQNIKSLTSNLKTCGFVQVSRDHSIFKEVWAEYVQSCKTLRVYPSGGKVKPPEDRTFFLPRRPFPKKVNGKDEGELAFTPDEAAKTQGFEGAYQQVTTNRFERDPGLRAACIEYHRSLKDGRLACEVCYLDFNERYGEIGDGFIHVHHLTPLAAMDGSGVVVSEMDLVPVCPNCHAMLHRGQPNDKPRSIEELRQEMTRTSISS